MTQSWCYQSVK